MPVITLPDGSKRSYDAPLTLMAIAEDIGPGLAKAALAGKVDGRMVDLSYTLSEDAEIALITANDEEGLEVLRHSSAHLLAQAVKELFPEAQVTIGPVIEKGFYYDFAFERAFTPEDLEAIEVRMQEIAKRALPVERFELSRNEAVDFFQSLGELYKAEIIESIPEDEVLSLYRQGDFVDLCRGPHVPNTDRLKVFKLMKVAGAYWRGDASLAMLQRVYGTAWGTPKALKTYLFQLAEAEKRDHRRLGQQQDLFHIQEEAPGMAFWHPDGWTIYRAMQSYMRERLNADGYREINTPMIAARALWEKSGHWEKFGDDMFFTQSEKKDFAIKPMNCPCHIQVFNQGLKSYRDLPLRLAEFGACHRNELSGALHGLMRVRHFVQDDAHIFCTPAQVQSEVERFVRLLQSVYHDFGFNKITVYLSTRPEKRIGEDALWDKAEADLAAALDATGQLFSIQAGEGAFYGPKVEFHLEDAIGRTWQCGTIQLDYCLPERLGATYVTETGEKAVPVMLHRAVLGTFERFLGILIEHYEGRFPVWLAPWQLVLMTITERQDAYAEEIAKTLETAGFRVKRDLRNEKIGFKIREHTLARIPFQVVLGEKEAASRTVSVRSLSGDDLGVLSLESLIELLREAVASKSHGFLSLEEATH